MLEGVNVLKLKLRWRHVYDCIKILTHVNINHVYERQIQDTEFSSETLYQRQTNNKEQIKKTIYINIQS